MFHEGIAPDATYTVDTIHEECSVADEVSFSTPREFPTARWGDVSGEFDFVSGVWTGVDGRVDIPVDVVALLDKFTNHPRAPSKARTDLAPARPDQRVDNIPDLLRVLDAFMGLPYPFDAPDRCP